SRRDNRRFRSRDRTADDRQYLPPLLQDSTACCRMTDRLRFTITGCGSSPGVPRIVGDWGNCDPHNPKNRRTRSANVVERISAPGGVTRVAIDTGPDFRQQMLDANVAHLDAVVYTHAHADHIHGIDDLRGYFLAQRKRIDVYGDKTTLERIEDGFGYCFKSPP